MFDLKLRKYFIIIPFLFLLIRSIDERLLCFTAIGLSIAALKIIVRKNKMYEKQNKRSSDQRCSCFEIIINNIYCPGCLF